MKLIYYIRLRELMARHGMSKYDIANIIGKSYRQTSKMLHREVSPESGKPYVFDIIEAAQIVMHFRRLGEDVTIDNLFFNQAVSNENKIA